MLFLFSGIPRIRLGRWDLAMLHGYVVVGGFLNSSGVHGLVVLSSSSEHVRRRFDFV